MGDNTAKWKYNKMQDYRFVLSYKPNSGWTVREIWAHKITGKLKIIEYVEI